MNRTVVKKLSPIFSLITGLFIHCLKSINLCYRIQQVIATFIKKMYGNKIEWFNKADDSLLVVIIIIHIIGKTISSVG